MWKPRWHGLLTGTRSKSGLGHGSMGPMLCYCVQSLLAWPSCCYMSKETDVCRPARQAGTRVSWQFGAADATCLPAGYLTP